MPVSRPDYQPAWKRRCALSLRFASCLAMVGCSETDPAASPGELGRASFRYECIEPADHHCRRGAEQLPERIAVGGRFRLEISGSGTNAQLVSPELVRIAYRDQFEFVRPGVAAFLATKAYDDAFFDFVHLLALPVTDLRVQHAGVEATEVAVSKGRAFSLSVVPYRDGEWLAGSLNAAWTSSDSEVVRITERGMTVSLMAVDEGVAEVTARFDEVSTSVKVFVGPPGSNPIPIPDGGAAASDGGPRDAAMDAANPSTVADAGADAAISDASQVNEAGPGDASSSTSPTLDDGGDGGPASPPNSDAGRDGGTP